ncbi:MAG TPA: RDD family protein [Steroidobacteraceae bacterium]
MDSESTIGVPAGLFRRLAALSYDLLLTIALAFVATFALLPLSRGEAILASTQGVAAHLYHALLFLLVFGYFGLCWTRGGQTLGMKAWRIRLQAADGRRFNWGDAVVRFTTGAAFTLMAVTGSVLLLRHDRWPEFLVGGLLWVPAIGNLAWIAFDGSARSLQDLAGRMRVMRLG